jgi:hypothetical protein
VNRAIELPEGRKRVLVFKLAVYSGLLEIGGELNVFRPSNADVENYTRGERN